jgi:hypothetical protein
MKTLRFYFTINLILETYRNVENDIIPILNSKNGKLATRLSKVLQPFLFQLGMLRPGPSLLRQASLSEIRTYRWYVT